MKLLSVILPAYNEQDMIALAAETISEILTQAEIPFEILFVNDGSKDQTWEEIQKTVRKDPRIRGLCFSRNFGKEAAITAGLEAAQGACAVVLDCDLQHPPEKIVEMYRLWEEGFEIIAGIKADRGKEGRLHGTAARAFYKLISSATGIDMQNASDFKLLDRKAIDALCRMPERSAFFRAMSAWIGFKETTVTYEVQPRKAGESKWSTSALFQYALTNISSFSSAPMQIVTFLGVITFVMSAVFGVIALYQKLIGAALGGFTTVILLLGFIGSIIMISLGIIGYYLSKIYEEIKGRPRYIVSETAAAQTGNCEGSDANK